MDKNFFIISDTHFGHKNIIDYCGRPFSSAEEMDEEMIRRWNETVTNNDVVLHLGDVAFGNKDYCRQILKRLNGVKILIRGNHDKFSDDFYRSAGFSYVSRYPIVWNNFFLLSHAPLQLSETTPYFNYYGHVHNDEKFINSKTSKCVSVERINYTPLLIFTKTEDECQENI